LIRNKEFCAGEGSKTAGEVTNRAWTRLVVLIHDRSDGVESARFADVGTSITDTTGMAQTVRTGWVFTTVSEYNS